jgi:hypothetical protein
MHVTWTRTQYLAILPEDKSHFRQARTKPEVKSGPYSKEARLLVVIKYNVVVECIIGFAVYRNVQIKTGLDE